MLNLPRVTGWGTDTIANTLMQKSAEKRADEKDLLKMRANALMQGAQTGNFTDEGYKVVADTLGTGVADSLKSTSEKAKSENESRLQQKKLEMSLIGLKSANEKIDMIDKLGKLGDLGTDNAKILTDEINSFYKTMGLDINIKPYMDAAVRKTQTEKANVTILNGIMKAAEDNPTPENITEASNVLTTFSNKIPKEFATIYQKRIDAANKRAEEKQKQQAEIEKENRAKQTKIDEEQRTQKIKMTNPKNGRTVDIPVSQQAQFEKNGWELGGRSENKPETVINVGNVVDKQRAEDIATMKSPKFRAGVIRDVRASNKDAWDMAGSKKERDDLIRAEADVRVKNIYPNATFGKGKQGKGWYIKTAKGYELAVPWNE